ncbi:MAG: hypothetical protein ACUVWZ_00315 [Anaerolineae bacterium]
MQNLDLQKLELLFYSLLGLILVTLAALVIYVVVANRRERAKLAQQYEEARLAPRPTLEVTGRILSLSRDHPGGPLQVEIRGTKYRNIAEIKDAQVRRQLIAAAMELIQFTGVLGEEVAEPAPLEKTLRWREDLREGSQSELKRIYTPFPGETLSQTAPIPKEDKDLSLDRTVEMEQPPSPPERPSVIGAIRRRMTPKVSEADKPRPFVDEIEEIVQRRIQLIPALAARELHVRASPEGTVYFTFEGKEYEALDQVPNLTARQLIRDAIQEWEETT